MWVILSTKKNEFVFFVPTSVFKDFSVMQVWTDVETFGSKRATSRGHSVESVARFEHF